MLIRFAVENFMSFKDRQIFSMIAAKHTRHMDHVASICGKRILKGSFLFGANASGKSNFIKAVYYAKQIIFYGLDKADVDRKYFRIESGYAQKPGMFQFDIFAGDSFYSYGFAFSYMKREILSEWLYRIVDGNEICIFESETNEGRSSIKTEMHLAKDDGYRFRIYGEDLSRSRTFLQDISEKEIVNTASFKAFHDVWEWFRSLVVIFPYSHMNVEGMKTYASDDDFNHILNSLDTGRRSVIFKNEPISTVLDNVPPHKRQLLLNDIERGLKENKGKVSFIIAGKAYLFELKDDEILASLQLIDNGNPSELFSFSDESDGTRRLFDLLPLAVGLDGNGVILIDEVDRSFHTKLLIQYIEMFYKNSRNLNIQLIATLHDVNLMNFDILRQDEIWFIRRDEQSGASDMYSLNRFQIRYDKKIIKDYLLGRFGAIPCFGQAMEADDMGETIDE